MYSKFVPLFLALSWPSPVYDEMPVPRLHNTSKRVSRSTEQVRRDETTGAADEVIRHLRKTRCWNDTRRLEATS